MKTVDENYSYDELEGFQALDLKRTRGDAKELWVLFGNKHISLSQAALITVLLSVGSLVLVILWEIWK